MSSKTENRVRNKTISFYVSEAENAELQARIKLTGMPKGEYFIQSLLKQKIVISVGKYQSDRLSLEFKKLRISLENTSETEQIVELLQQCKELLNQMVKVTNDNINQEDFKIQINKESDEKWTKKE